MDEGRNVMNLPLETVFVPGCPNIKSEPPERKPMEQIFVAELPIIREQTKDIKTEYSDDESDVDYDTNFPSQSTIDLPKESIVKSQDGCGGKQSVVSEVKNELENGEDLHKNEVKKEIEKSEEPNCNKAKKRVRKTRLKPCDLITLEPKFVCNICTTGFQRINNYTIHMKKKHQIYEATPYACPNCPRKYEFEYELKRHMKKYKPIEERRVFPCTQCDRKFQTMVHVNRHIRYVHDNTRPFVCEQCGEAMHTASMLKEHMLIHSNIFPFQCKQCGKSFKQKQRLKRHMEVHGDKHVCNQCGKELSSRCTLTKHLLVHTEGKPHKCEYCGRAFKLVKTLKVHLNTHTGERTYNCQFCDRRFAAPSSRRQHALKKHAEKLKEQEALKANQNVPSQQNFTNDTDKNMANIHENFLSNKLPETVPERYNIQDFKMYHNPIDFSSNIVSPETSTTMYNTHSTAL